MHETVQQDSLAFRERMLEAKQCLGCGHEGIVVTALDGTVLETSLPAERILEIPSSDLRARSLQEFCLAHDVYGELIAPEVQAKLFEPFFTTKAHGTGLGLATSQQILFEHNGHLLVESRLGKGTTFSLLLPI